VGLAASGALIVPLETLPPPPELLDVPREHLLALVRIAEHMAAPTMPSAPTEPSTTADPHKRSSRT